MQRFFVASSSGTSEANSSATERLLAEILDERPRGERLRRHRELLDAPALEGEEGEELAALEARLDQAARLAVAAADRSALVAAELELHGEPLAAVEHGEAPDAEALVVER